MKIENYSVWLCRPRLLATDFLQLCRQDQADGGFTRLTVCTVAE